MLSKEASGRFIDFTVPTSLPEDDVRKRLMEDGWREDVQRSHLMRDHGCGRAYGALTSCQQGSGRGSPKF